MMFAMNRKHQARLKQENIYHLVFDKLDRIATTKGGCVVQLENLVLGFAQELAVLSVMGFYNALDL